MIDFLEVVYRILSKAVILRVLRVLRVVSTAENISEVEASQVTFTPLPLFTFGIDGKGREGKGRRGLARTYFYPE